MYSLDAYASTKTTRLPSLGAIALIGGLVAGTGNTYDAAKVDKWKDFVQPMVGFKLLSGSDFHQDSSLEYSDIVDVRTVAQHLANVKEILSPSMSSLASDLDISRQALYKWLSGENKPEDIDKINYIKALSSIADTFRNEGVTDAPHLFKMKAFNGKNINDVLKAHGDWAGALKLLVRESKAISESFESSNLTQVKGKSTSDWKSDVSFPGVFE